MTHIDVKPAPTIDRAAWSVLKHPASGGLLDAAGAVPDSGRPWLNDGFTARMLMDGAVLRADDPVFAAIAAAEEKAKADAGAATKADAEKVDAPPAAELDPAH